MWQGWAGHGGVAWRGVAWRGVAWRGVAWRGAAWHGVAWRGMAARSMTWRGGTGRGVAAWGVAWRHGAWRGGTGRGVAARGMAWHGMAWRWAHIPKIFGEPLAAVGVLTMLPSIMPALNWPTNNRPCLPCHHARALARVGTARQKEVASECTECEHANLKPNHASAFVSSPDQRRALIGRTLTAHAERKHAYMHACAGEHTRNRYSRTRASTHTNTFAYVACAREHTRTPTRCACRRSGRTGR